MMTEKTYSGNRRRREDGVALIFALAILALLLVMLIGFLASSILEQRIAYNQSSQVAANVAARSALVRVESQLAAYADDLAWFRYRPDTTTHPKLLAPLVSFGTTAGALPASDKTATASDAYTALRPLLENYIAPDNWFPSGVAVDYPQWIYLTANGRLTGRFAYVAIPNLGIDPALLGDGTTVRAGIDYDELPLSGLGFLSSAAVSTVLGRSNWLSLDLLTGRKGIYQSSDFTLANVGNEFNSGSVTGREAANFYFTTNQPKVKEKANGSGEQPQQGADRLDLTHSVTMAQAQSLVNGLDLNTALKNQVAANLVDYIDGDDIPTSDVDPTLWPTGGTPTYTGNEMTPYLNQIAAKIESKVAYTVDAEDNGDGTKNVTQTVAIDLQSDIVSELINIYDKALGYANVTYKDVEIELEIRITKGGTALTGWAPKTVNLTKGGVSTPIISTVTSTANTTAIPARSYIAESLPASNYLTATTVGATEVTSNVTTIPEIKVIITITKFKFDRAVEKWDKSSTTPTTYVDFVNGLTLSTSQTLLSETFSEDPATKTVTGIIDFEVNDPRCNLSNSDWSSSYSAGAAAMSAATIPNQGSKNSGTNAKNTSASAEKDLEPDADPVKLSTAYIRNAPMQSAWELGLIHRGEAWKTINLKSAADPLTESSSAGKYIDDARLLDKIKCTTDAEAHKFNVNTPAQNVSAFGVLTNSLVYHDPGYSIVDTTTDPLIPTITIEPTTAKHGITLSADAATALKTWIANKCYEAAGTPKDPTAATSKVYQRYIHRGMLARAITDWALNSSDSPYKIYKDSGTGKDLSDAHLEELIGKIVPLIRCGDTYESFTVFAVGQAIKDVGSASGANFVRYDADGTRHDHNCAFGTWDDGFDQVTAVTYLVARLRREIDHCEGTVNCKQGLHDEKCTFKVTEIEGYTFTEL